MCRGKFAHAYYPASYKKWREEFLNALADAEIPDNWAIPVHVTATFVVTRPKTTKRLTPKGDIDNYQKSLLDALTDAGAWTDDTLVESITATKRFTREGEPAGIHFEIKESC
jgi:Holliday junction resolvase RusA-like endonuclease